MVAAKEEQLIYDLVGFGQGSNNTLGDSQVISAILHESHRSDELNTIEAILNRVISQTLISYSVDQRLDTKEVIDLLDPNELG